MTATVFCPHPKKIKYFRHYRYRGYRAVITNVGLVAFINKIGFEWIYFSFSGKISCSNDLTIRLDSSFEIWEEAVNINKNIFMQTISKL